MAQFESIKDEILAAGNLVYVAAEKREGFFRPGKYLREHPVSFPFLLDEDRAVSRQYGVYHRIGLDAYHIARPATFVLAPDRVIRYLHVGADQHDRKDIREVLQALKDAKRS